MVSQLKKNLSNPDSLVSLFLGLAVVLVVGVLIVNYIKERRPTQESAQNGTKEEQQQKAEQATASATAEYTVKSGDTLWSIAQNTIGSGYNWVDIRDANKITSPGMIEVGQKLSIPRVSKREPGQIAASSVETKRPADGKYTVQKGESLWMISEKVYGTGYRWTEIAKLNNITDPNVIFTGNVLTLP